MATVSISWLGAVFASMHPRQRRWSDGGTLINAIYGDLKAAFLRIISNLHNAQKGVTAALEGSGTVIGEKGYEYPRRHGFQG